MTIRASIIGASGYAGGELLRLLLAHPEVEVAQVTSRRFANKFVHTAHPNLRGATKLKFVEAANVEPCDMLFLALPHFDAAADIEKYTRLAPKLIDLSADFRLRDPAAYEAWYGQAHPSPDWLGKFVYGLPELNRDAIANANFVSGVGCNATATNLALFPLAKKGLIERAVIEVKVGSSEGGNRPSLGTHHPERTRVVRSFAPTGHRHQAEMKQELGEFELHFSATAVELVRGVMCTAHVFLNEPHDDKALWRLYREAFAHEPFLRIVKDRQGVYRYPEPKILAGTNFADVGFETDTGSGRVVVMSAIDNLMKGAAGTAVQSMNLMHGFAETTGLEFVGLHPV